MLILRHAHRLPDDFVHTHEGLYEIMYCIRGTYRFHYRMPDEKMETDVLRQDKSLILIPPGIPHGVHVLEYPYERYFIQFTEQTANAVLGQNILNAIFQENEQQKAFREVPRFLNVPNDYEKLETIQEKMYTVALSTTMDENWKEVYERSLLGSLFCELYNMTGSSSHAVLAELSPVVQSVKEYCEVHYAQPIAIAELAEDHHVSANYLTRCFRTQMGISPRNYLTQIRLAAAQRFLCSGSFSVQEIAEKTGFRDVNYFIKCFKTQYGQTPMQYRKAVLQKSQQY